MTIDDAIEILDLIKTEYQEGTSLGEVNALKLGIQALKAVQKFQSMGSKIYPLRLPGETKD